ncbi:hypothetical protein DRN69_08205, partial [Candidatus Pacearchaeota archaeon]
MTPHKSLKGLEKITEILKIVFASGNIDDKPLSVMLIAPVGSGKTTAIKQFQNNKNILITTDSTAWGILKKYQKELKNGEIRHIVIPDLHSALSRRKTTADQLILFINNSSEDGIFPSKTYGIQIDDFIEPFGWILCLTTEGFKRKYKFLKEVGFINRFFIVKYEYSLEQLKTILNEIIKETTLKIPNLKLKQRRKRCKIEGNKEIFNDLIPYSKLLCRNNNSEILRTQRRLQTFLKSNAYLNNRK